MIPPAPPIDLSALDRELAGEARADALSRMIYATDASVYRRLPPGVVFPRGADDIARTLSFAAEHGLGVIPRAAGTSLAGQCVGEGIVVDVSRHMTAVLHVDPAARTATVEPGVIRDDLNRALAPHGLFCARSIPRANEQQLRPSTGRGIDLGAPRR